MRIPQLAIVLAARLPSRWRLSLVVLATACQSLRPRPVTADHEGLVNPPSPPRIHAARQLDAALARNGLGGLVIVVAPRSRVASALHVQLFSNDFWRGMAREDSTDASWMFTFRDLPPGAYSGTARRIGAPPQQFRVIIQAGFADTLELTPGWNTAG